MTHRTLIDTATLAALSPDSSLAIIDCRFELADTSSGEREYLDAHIPGAVYAHLDRDLSGAKTGHNGRHPLPDPVTLAGTLGAMGISSDTQVVAYDQGSGMYASRLWWLLRWLGHDAVAVLDGGWAAWTAENRPRRSGAETRASRLFSGAARASLVVDAQEVSATARSRDSLLIDARAPERFRGDVEPLDPVGGHIPGAVNRFFQSNLSEGRFRSREELHAAWSALLGNVRSEHVVCYCGSGVTACHNLLAMEHAGLSGARLYPGSWSEWVAEPAGPVETGAASRG